MIELPERKDLVYLRDPEREHCSTLCIYAQPMADGPWLVRTHDGEWHLVTIDSLARADGSPLP